MKSIYLTFSIYPQNSGQSVYSYALAKNLIRNTKLYLFSYADQKNNEKNTLFDIFEQVSFYKYKEVRGFKSTITKLAVLNYVDNKMLTDIVECIQREQITTVIIDHIGMTSFFYPLKRRFPNLNYVYSSQNVESLNIVDSLLYGGRNKKFWRLRAILNKAAERQILNKVDNIISISNKDKQYFINNMHINKPIYLSHPQYDFKCLKNTIDLNKFNKKLLIVGSMNWYPNILGTIRFVKEVYSELITIDSEYELYIVGKNPTQDIVDLSFKYQGIEITGFVDDVDAYYKLCDIAIVPVFEGSGIKIKLIEAIGKGMPVVASAFAAKDYDIKDEICVANNKQEFIDSILKISKEVEYRKYLHKGSLNLFNSIIKSDPDIDNIFKGVLK